MTDIDKLTKLLQSMGMEISYGVKDYSVKVDGQIKERDFNQSVSIIGDEGAKVVTFTFDKLGNWFSCGRV